VEAFAELLGGRLLFRKLATIRLGYLIARNPGQVLNLLQRRIDPVRQWLRLCFPCSLIEREGDLASEELVDQAKGRHLHYHLC